MQRIDDKKRNFGVGELLFGIVILLGVAGTISFFFIGEYLGEHQATFMIVSNLAFIGGFFALSVYARRKKARQIRRLPIARALANWLSYHAPASSGSFGPTPGGSFTPTPGGPSAIGPGGQAAPLPPRTLESIAAHLYLANGYRMAPQATPAPAGMLRILNHEDRLELIQCRQEAEPLSLRDVVSFYETFRAEKAVHGEIWALGGFNEDAAHWVAKKPIVLLDALAIHEIVESLLPQ
jgi:hypothetical protein